MADHGWANVTVIEADATTAALLGPFDGAVASLSMSVLPDVDRAVRNVYDAMRPGARFVVFDLRPVAAGPARILNPGIRWFLQWYANWNPHADVSAALTRVFDEAAFVETYAWGTAYTMVARRTDAAPPERA